MREVSLTGAEVLATEAEAADRVRREYDLRASEAEVAAATPFVPLVCK